MIEYDEERIIKELKRRAAKARAAELQQWERALVAMLEKLPEEQ